MALENYRDISRLGPELGAGFQFEFSCGNCGKTWRSPLKPYRKGQFAALIWRIAYYIGDRGTMSRASSTVASIGETRARDAALREALELAEQHYVACPSCEKNVCERCWDPAARECVACAKQEAHSGAGAAEGGGSRCPNCGTGTAGGRFCPECGFDMASTHKACPTCGALTPRSARFCTDCGHGF